MAFFDRLGLGLTAPTSSRRVVRRPCLDWSERRWHLAGRLGAALAGHCFDQGWVARRHESRAVTITPTGRQRLPEIFHIDEEAVAPSVRRVVSENRAT